MSKSKKSKSELNLQNLVDLLKKHWIFTIVGAIFAFSAGVQATTWVINSLSTAYEQNIGWKTFEQQQLNRLGAGEQIGYMRSILGEPIFRDGGEKYQEYVFKRRFGYVQAVTDKNDKVVLYSVVICKKDFKPTINLLANRKVTMLKDSLKSSGDGRTYYSISGATANSYLMEGGYDGNPSNYQAIYVGATDSCGVLEAPDESYGILQDDACKGGHLGLQGFTEPHCQYDTNKQSIVKLREAVKVNTVVITAPEVSLSDLSPTIHFGPSRIQLRVLPQYYQEWK